MCAWVMTLMHRIHTALSFLVMPASERFKHLAGKHYLASVAGRNHSWEAIVGNKSLARFLANSREPEASANLADKLSKYEKDGVLHVRFKYNSATT